MKFRKKPVVIEAIQHKGNNWEELIAWCPYGLSTRSDNKPIFIQTLEGKMQCDVGDWIIKRVKGEFYPCKPDIFELTYEPFYDSNVPVIPDNYKDTGNNFTPLPKCEHGFINSLCSICTRKVSEK